MENQQKISDKRIFKDDENGFEVHFKPLKLGAYVALMIGIGLIVIDYGLFKNAWSIGYFKYMMRNPLYLLGFFGLKLAIIYIIYLVIYTFKSDYIVKLDNKSLSKFSAPIPRLRGNKSILRNDIESYKIEKSSSTTRVSQTSYTRGTQTYYNLRIKLKGKDEFTFFYSLSQDDTHLIKRLLDKHIK